MYVDLLFVIMLEVAKTALMKKYKNNHNLSGAHAVVLVAILVLFVFNYTFFPVVAKIHCRNHLSYNKSS